jgi:hypothetical protein
VQYTVYVVLEANVQWQRAGGGGIQRNWIKPPFVFVCNSAEPDEQLVGRKGR